MVGAWGAPRAVSSMTNNSDDTNKHAIIGVFVAPISLVLIALDVFGTFRPVSIVYLLNLLGAGSTASMVVVVLFYPVCVAAILDTLWRRGLFK